MFPPQQGPAELVDLRRASWVLQIVTETTFDELERQRRVGVRVQFSNRLLSVPRGADLAPWITGGEEAEQLGPAAAVEAFIGTVEEPPRPIQRVILVASMAERLVLETTPDLVQLLVGQVRSAWSALPVFRQVGLSWPSPEPDVRLPTHPALHEPVPLVKQRSRSVPTVSGSSSRGSGSE